MVRAEGGSLRFWGPGLLSTSPALSMSSASHSAGSSGWLAQKRELGQLSSGQGKSMQFVDPDRIEQSDHVQAASFAPMLILLHQHQLLLIPLVPQTPNDSKMQSLCTVCLYCTVFLLKYPTNFDMKSTK